MSTSEAIEAIRLRFENKYNVSGDIVDEIFKLFSLSRDLHYESEKIRFAFTDDEYGEAARELYKEKQPLKRSYTEDAGVDLPIVLTKQERVHGGVDVWPAEREMFHTGIIMEFPVGYWGRIVHRSSTEKIHRLRVVEGVIDDYRGEILVQVHNMNTAKGVVYHGDRLAQIILARVAPFGIEETDKLRPSKRGSNGFGSSGK